MSGRPARGGARRAPAPRRAPARPRGRAARRGSWLGRQIGRAVEAIPLPAGTIRALRNGALAILMIGGLAAGVIAMGVPEMAGMAAAHALGRLGLVVRTVEIAGRSHADRDAIYRVVMDQRGQDMPLVDLAAVRRALLGLGWVQDARVSRRLPDTLVIDLVERRPAAIWQYRQRLQLVDAGGVVIAPVDPRTIPDQLPLVIGPNANAHVGALAGLIATQPSLRPLIEGATWIGDRRWDLRFQSGETLALPEGDAAARAAFATFARKDSQARLLGQGYVRFDMRNPGEIVVRMSREPGARVAPPAPDKSI